MIPYKTFTDEIFSIGSFHVQPWGLMVSIGFLIGLLIIGIEAKRRKLNPQENIQDYNFRHIIVPREYVGFTEGDKSWKQSCGYDSQRDAGSSTL